MEKNMQRRSFLRDTAALLTVSGLVAACEGEDTPLGPVQDAGPRHDDAANRVSGDIGPRAVDAGTPEEDPCSDSEPIFLYGVGPEFNPEKQTWLVIMYIPRVGDSEKGIKYGAWILDGDKVVRTICENEAHSSSPAGTGIIVGFDGKNDNHMMVPAGNYRFLIKVTGEDSATGEPCEETKAVPFSVNHD